ncbi:MAG: tetratricopeptide repeat protein [Verrucomicrobiota bacterium]
MIKKIVSYMLGRLLLVEWDAADWKVLHPLIDSGKMPALNRLVEGGVSGELLSVQPLVSAMLCTSIMTGKRAWQHGICHAMEPGQPGRPVTVSAAARRTAALWQMLAHTGRRSVVAGWPASHNEKTGNCVFVSDRYPEPTAGPGIKPWPPAVPGTYWPESLRAQLDPKRSSPEQIDASVISRYIPEWQRIEQARDHRIGQLRLCLAADYSYQTAMLALLKQEPWDFAAVRFPALGPISKVFIPPHLFKPGDIAPPEFEFYKDVLSTTCRILDNMLHQLTELAGKDATVMLVSAHGARTQGVPPGGFAPSNQESWKSTYGIFAACGPNVVRDALIHGASVLDVAPTILTFFGLPIGDDMEGRVLIEAFRNTPEISRVNSWDSQIEIPPRPNMENPSPDNLAVTAWRRESDWQFAQSGMEAGRYSEVLPVLDRLFREFPERVEVGYALFQCQLALNQLSCAADTLEVVLESIPAGMASLLPRAELAMARKDFRQARSLVAELNQLNPTHPPALRRLGLLLLRLREWDALEQIASRALHMDDQDPIAWLGLAAAQLRKGKPKDAEESAARAIGLKFFLPDAHFILARALVAQGRWLEAHKAMQALLKIQPENRTAATYLKRIPSNPAV